MKNIHVTNRGALLLNAAILTLTLALLAGTPTLVGARDGHGKINHRILKNDVTHALGHASGLRCDWSSWLRRWIPI
jgi:hypothetical protein